MWIMNQLIRETMYSNWHEMLRNDSLYQKKTVYNWNMRRKKEAINKSFLSFYETKVAMMYFLKGQYESYPEVLVTLSEQIRFRK